MLLSMNDSWWTRTVVISYEADVWIRTVEEKH